MTTVVQEMAGGQSLDEAQSEGRGEGVSMIPTHSRWLKNVERETSTHPSMNIH